MPSNNKHQSHLIRKKFKKSKQYKCCYVSNQNVNKLSRSYCGSFTKKYRRTDRKLNALLTIKEEMKLRS